MTSDAGELERLRVLAEDTKDILYSFTPEGTIESMYGPVERLSGHKARDLVGRSVFELIDPSDRPIAKRHHMDKLEAKADSSLYELRLLRKGGGVIWREISSREVRKGGKLVAKISARPPAGASIRVVNPLGTPPFRNTSSALMPVVTVPSAMASSSPACGRVAELLE